MGTVPATGKNVALVGTVALVGGAGLGKAIALALGAQGVQVVVVGPDERLVAETVGEIVYGGGSARHFVGDPADASVLAGAQDKARRSFGVPHFLVAAGQLPLTVRDGVQATLAPPGRVVVVGEAAGGGLPGQGAGHPDGEGAEAQAVVADVVAFLSGGGRGIRSGAPSSEPWRT